MENLLNAEQYWATRQRWLLWRGYQLRARYQPDWVPSWITDPPKKRTDNWLREDYSKIFVPKIMDAVRVQDNQQVMLKKVRLPGVDQDYELSVLQYLSRPDITQDPQNRCVPVYDVLFDVPDDPNHAIIVMPLLRSFDSPRFDTVGECLGFFQEIFQGVQFLHRHHIAHRDCSGPNVMIDASELYPDGFHARQHDYNREFTGPAVQKFTRTQRPPRYYWIDFGLAVRFHESDKSPRVRVLRGIDKSAPEFLDPNYMEYEQDPFPTDIYYLGNLVRRYFTEGWPDAAFGKKSDLSFLEPLVEAMVQDDRAKRPTIDQCVMHLDEIIRSQSSWKLRSQVWHSTDNIFGFLYRFLPHWIRRIGFIIFQTPAVPRSSYALPAAYT